MPAAPILRIGTRSSPLALAQAQEVRGLLGAVWPELAAEGAIEIVHITTSGDKTQSTGKALSEFGNKGLFTKEIEEALIEGSIDLAVHSMKDMPTELPPGLVIPCILPREDPRDAFFSPHAATLDDLPAGSVVGTASLRRQALVLARRPDLKVVTFRGNVGTRIAKLERGEADATLLAQAGLNRLGMGDAARSILAVEAFMPAVAQGAVGVEIRAGDEKTAALLAPLNCATTTACLAAERAMLAALDGSCRTPVAGLATLAQGRMHLEALVVRPNGTDMRRTARDCAVADAAHAGLDAGEELRRDLPADFFHAA